MHNRKNHNKKPQHSQQEKAVEEYLTEIRDKIADQLPKIKSKHGVSLLTGVEVSYDSETGYKVLISLVGSEAMNPLLRKTMVSNISTSIKKTMTEIQNSGRKKIIYSFEFEYIKKDLEKISTDVLDGIIQKLTPLIKSNTAVNINKLHELSQPSYDYKLQWIRDNLELFLKANLKENYFHLFEKNFPLILNGIMFDCLLEAKKKLTTNLSNLTTITINFTESIAQYIQLEQENDSFTFIWNNVIKKILGTGTLLQQSSQLLLLNSFLEDIIEETKLLLPVMEKDLQACMVLSHVYEKFHEIFAGVSSQDQKKILQSDQLFALFKIEDINHFISKYHLNMDHLKTNIDAYERGLAIISIYRNILDMRINTEIIENQDENELETPKVGPLENQDEDALGIPKVELLTLNNNTPTTATPSTPSNYANNPCVLFSSGPSYSFSQPTSLTYECQKDSLEKIKKAEEKKLKKEQKTKEKKTLNENENPLQMIEKTIDKDKSLIYISKNNETIEAEMFHLSGKFIFLCCDMQFVKSANKEKLAIFQSAASTFKILKRDSLGVTGIKIYGLEFLIVKSTQDPGHHLLCFPHLITGTNKYVYLPAEIATHQEYKNYLINRTQLIAKSQSNSVRSITISQVPLEKENTSKIRRGLN